MKRSNQGPKCRGLAFALAFLTPDLISDILQSFCCDNIFGFLFNDTMGYCYGICFDILALVSLGALLFQIARKFGVNFCGIIILKRFITNTSSIAFDSKLLALEKMMFLTQFCMRDSS